MVDWSPAIIVESLDDTRASCSYHMTGTRFHGWAAVEHRCIRRVGFGFGLVYTYMHVCACMWVCACPFNYVPVQHFNVYRNKQLAS